MSEQCVNYSVDCKSEFSGCFEYFKLIIIHCKSLIIVKITLNDRIMGSWHIDTWYVIFAGAFTVALRQGEYGSNPDSYRDCLLHVFKPISHRRISTSYFFISINFHCPFCSFSRCILTSMSFVFP